MDQVVALPLARQRPWRLSRRGGRRLGKVLVLSLWLHLTVLLLFIMTVHYQHREEELPPPSTVSMVFEGGKPEGPALPNPQLNVAPTAPPSPPPAPSPAPAPEQRAAPAPAPAPPAPPVAAAPPAPAPPTPTTAEPLPLPPPPPAANAEVPVLKPPPLAMVVPRPQVPRPLPPLTAPPAVAPRPSRPQEFPAPTNFSLNAAPSQMRPPAPRTTPRGAPSTLDFSLAPRRGATDTSPFSRVAGAHVGPDWRNELSAWVRAHAYYPEQAAMNGEDGDVMVQVVAQPNGHVTSVEMVQRSGSRWLDMALTALFRDANLPPLHTDEGITFNFTMHYILIRTP